MKRRKLSYQPIALIVIGAVLILSAVIFMALNTNSASSNTASVTGEEQTYPEIKRVSVKDARAAWELKSATIVDVRSKDSYDQGHIPGALSIPENELAGRLNELNPNDWIITYCT